MPDLDPAREITSTGISEPKGHSPNVFAAPGEGVFGAGKTGVSHHPAPAFGMGRMDWSAILDGLPYGLIVLGPNQDLRHENAACRQMSGYGVGEKGGVEGWLSALCPDPGHREKVINSWREQIWRTQLTRTFTLRTADQKPKEFEFRSSLLRDGGITLTIEDVTEARRGEDSLRHGKLKFRALFSHTRTGTVLVDRTGRIIDANPAFLSLTGNSLKELRLSSLSGLLHPDEAASLAEAEEALLSAPDERGSMRVLSREVWLRTRSGEKRSRLSWCPVVEASGPPILGIYLFERLDADTVGEHLKTRLRTVSKKAQALLNAVPDLILLIDADGTVADYAPPPQPWKELVPDESWKQRPAAEVWPVLGNLLGQCRTQIIDEARTVHADIRGSESEGFEFSVTLSPCGEGQILVVVRNQSATRLLRERDLWQSAAFDRAPLAMVHLDTRGIVTEANLAASTLLGEGDLTTGGRDFVAMLEEQLPVGTTTEFFELEQEGRPRGAIVFLKPATPISRDSDARAPLATQPRERKQHGFRNQLQLITSLFSLEPQSAAAREAFMKWQVRLRSMAQACPYDDSTVVWVFPLLRNLADEICSLVGRGPGRREVIVTGDEDLILDVQTATPFSLLIGELMRLVLATRQPGPGPELYVNLRPYSGGGFQLTVRPGSHRTFVFTDREAEIETLELLTEQIQGRLEVTDAENPAKEWVLIVPKSRL